MKSLDKVQEFMEAAQQEIKKELPKTLKKAEDRNVVRLRIRLMFEELKEFALACGKTGLAYFVGTCSRFIKDEAPYIEKDYEKFSLEDWDPVEALDALVDMRYVNDGTILALGFGEVFDNAFDDVHNNNLTKFTDSKEVMDDTFHHYHKKGIKVSFVSTKVRRKQVFACKDEDGKLKKPANYKPVNLKKYVD